MERFIVHAIDNRVYTLPDARLHLGDHCVGLGFAVRFGRNANVTLPGVRGKADGRVGRVFKVGDLVVQCALADPAGMQSARLDDLAQIELFFEVGEHGVLHQVPHLVGYAGQADDDAPWVLDDKARGGANRVFDRDRALGDAGLTEVVLAHRVTPPPEKEIDRLGQSLVIDQAAACSLGDGLARDVVHGRAQAARGNDHVRAIQRGIENARYPLLVVAGRSDVIEIQANVAKLAGDIGRVGVRDHAEEQLGAGSDDLCVQIPLPRDSGQRSCEQWIDSYTTGVMPVPCQVVKIWHHGYSSITRTFVQQRTGWVQQQSEQSKEQAGQVG